MPLETYCEYSDPDLAIEQEPIDAVSTYTDAVACLKSTNSLAKLWDFSIVARRRTDSRLRENFNIEGTTTGRFFSASEKAKVAYAPASSTPTSEAVALRSQIDAATRQVTDLHDLRFILFALDYILARKPS